MDTQVFQLIRNMNQMQKPQFLLVQGDDVLGVSENPMQLPFRDLHSSPWKIVVGTINEFGHQEIVGVAAEAYPSFEKSCRRITSPTDGDGRLIGNVCSMAALIRNRIDVLFHNECYDLANLPPTIIVRDCEPYETH